MQENRAQRNAIMHGTGPMLVLAGPGSGKTTVITRRILHLIQQYHVAPDTILVITFTRAAAMEMKERFLSLCNGIFLPVQFGTFHAIFFNILKERFQYNTKDILQNSEKIKILSDVIRMWKMDIPNREEVLLSILDEFSTMHHQGKRPENYVSFILEQDRFLQLYTQYMKTIQAMGKIDFDDMIILCHKLLEEEKDTLRKWQSKYAYILIDEFQDISPLQYDMVKKLASPQNNLFIVGDDDQSIYGFRGASPDIMFQFEKDYTNCKQILLDTNYRCSGSIVKAAGKVIERNRNRFPKKIVAINELGNPIHFIKTVDKIKEYQVLAECLLEEKKQHRLHHCAILCRTSQDFSFISVCLKQYGIDCICKEKKSSILRDEVYSDLIAYLELSFGNMTRKNFLQVMNKPMRFIEREMVEKEVKWESLMNHYKGNQVMLNILREFQKDLWKAKQMPLFLRINYIRKKMGYDAYLASRYQSQPMKLEEKRNLCEILQELAKGCKQTEQLKEMLKASAESPASQGKETEQPVLLTLHSSKGLEFDNVYILDCNEKNIPHHKAKTEHELEEERRMFYVGMTRAKQNLYLLYTTGSTEHSILPSPYLREIMESP